jgi:hypothetical protein
VLTQRLNTISRSIEALPYDGMTGFAAPHLSEYAETRNDLSG